MKGKRKAESWNVGMLEREKGKRRRRFLSRRWTVCPSLCQKLYELNHSRICNAFKTVPSEFRNDPYRFNQGRGVYSPSLVPRIYHIILRGINRQRIFEDEQDYYKFIQTLKDAKKESGFELKTVLL